MRIRSFLAILTVSIFFFSCPALAVDLQTGVGTRGLFDGEFYITPTAGSVTNSSIIDASTMRGNFSLACDLSALGNATVDIEMFVSNAEDLPSSLGDMYQTADYLLADDANATSGQNSDGKLWIDIDLENTWPFRFWGIQVTEGATENAAGSIYIYPAIQ